MKKFFWLLLGTSLWLTGCGAVPTEKPAIVQRPLVISAIPDQDPEKLQRLYETLASYLSTELGLSVIYKPVVDYTASVTAFKVGDLDLVWYGGLTGVQAHLQVEGRTSNYSTSAPGAGLPDARTCDRPEPSNLQVELVETLTNHTTLN